MINKKKCSIGLITTILLLSFVSSTFTVQADSPRTVYGTVYIDGETAPDGTTVKLSFTDQEFTNETFREGDYAMTFLEDTFSRLNSSFTLAATWSSSTTTPWDSSPGSSGRLAHFCTRISRISSRLILVSLTNTVTIFFAIIIPLDNYKLPAVC